MGKSRVNPPIEKMAKYLQRLHADRKTAIAKRKKEVDGAIHRKSLTHCEREELLKKTDSRCHLCGGKVTKGELEADHVFAHAVGGKHAVSNYLAAHGFCNRKRWMYSPEEFKMILKLGVWARHEIEKATPSGKKIFATLPKRYQTSN